MSVSLNYPHSNLQHQFSSPTNQTSLIYQTHSNSNMKPSPSSSTSSSTSPPNLHTVPETRALLISPATLSRPPRNPWRSAPNQPHPIPKFNQTSQTSNSNLNTPPATTLLSTPTPSSKHRKHLSTSSLLSILEHPSDHPPTHPHPSRSSPSDPAPTSSTSHMSSPPDSATINHHKSHRRHSSAVVVSPLSLSHPISASPRRPISFHQQNLLSTPATTPKSTPGSITKLLTRKLSFLSYRKAHVPSTSPNCSNFLAPPHSPSRIRSSSLTRQTAHNPGDDSEDAEFASADEGDERFWKHLKLPSPHRHTCPLPINPRSPNWSTTSYTDPTFNRPAKPAHSPLAQHKQVTDSALDPSFLAHNNQSDASTSSTSNRNSTYQSSIRFTSPTRLRGPSTKKIPAEFRAGRVFVRSSQIFADQAATLSSSDPSTTSVEESEQDQSSFSSYHPITPSSTPSFYPSVLPSSPTAADDQSPTKDSGILSRISEPFNSLLSAPNACLSPRRSPSSHSLAYRFNSGALTRSSTKSTVNGSTNLNGLLQPTPTSKSPPVKKSISMTFNLRHVPKFLNQRTKSDHVTDGEKMTTKAPDVQIIMPNLSQLGPNGFPPTWRSLVSPDRFLRLEQRFGTLEMKRQELIWELCRTELGYVESLEMIIKTFFQPLKKTQSIAPAPSGKTKSYTWLDIVPDSIINLFENLEEICELHQEICESIAENQQAHHVPKQLLILDDHQIPNADEHLLTKDPNSQFGAFIRARSQLEECGKMSFNSFLLKPIQRLMKYPLFLKQLCDVTPVLHPDHLEGKELWESTDRIIKEMQQVKVLEEDRAYLKSIESHIIGLAASFKLANGKRKLIRQGFVRRFHAASNRAQKQEFVSDDDVHHPQNPTPPDSHRRTTVSSSSSRSSSTAVDKRRRSRSQLSDDWSFSDHIGFRTSMKSTFCTSPLPDTHSSTPRMSKSSSASLKGSTSPQEYSSPRPDSHRTPLPARPDQQVSPSLPALSSSLGPTKIISRPKQLVPLSSSKTKMSTPKMSLNLKSSESKLDQLSTHHASDKQRGTLSSPADRNLKTKSSSSSLTFSARDQRQWKGVRQTKTPGRQKAAEILGLEREECKSKNEDESLYLFVFSDGLLLFTRPLADPRHNTLKRNHAGHPQLFTLVAEPLALSSLLGFRVLSSDHPSRRQPHAQPRSFTNDGHYPKPENGQLEKENKETKDWGGGGEGAMKRGRRRRAKTGPEPSRKAPSGRVELQVKCAHHAGGDARLLDRSTITLTLGLPGPLPASVAPSVYYALALDQTNTFTDPIRNAKNSHNAYHALDNNHVRNVPHDFVPNDPSAGLASVGRPELMHSLSLILFP
ncbi:hypothetical protein PTTG_06861 [Puccinia triticina 1-1 BBBD Race 1]|uniref:DH domain-containing protein n=1 Tax=Puccinia triticina (isolate 1-1 / race 1 (BBBD)) TaxID=630390 RepID=A0A180H3L2_PUCT1|nr:hypothetical protein PTTG_06861 [Puccinia triticina 1-1 BBBD Race 1]